MPALGGIGYFGAGSYQLVSSAQLDTPGFLNSFSSTVDPYDANLDALFRNGPPTRPVSHPLGFIQGDASALGGYGPQFTYGVGPIGSGNAIDNGVTFPFTDSDNSTFLTHVTGTDPNNVVDIYTSSGIDGLPAVLANDYVISGGGGGNVPEPISMSLLAVGLAGPVGARRLRRG